MQQPSWTQPSDIDFGFNPFASPIPRDEQAYYFPDAGGFTPAPHGAEPWAAPWSSNNDCGTDYSTSVTQSPAQAPMSMPDLLDMSSVRPISPSDGMHEPQSCTSSAAQAASIESAPAASLDAEVEAFLLSINVSFEPSSTASSSFSGLSPADVSEEDSSQTLSPRHLWTQGLDDWLNMDGAAA
ncbi:hypothetical protein OH76DRAFT_1015052 [Lentinus brumalis]|uniref:Uncharacterized protein n=1 Tax=Lentinus brumalis TaxID=2498619 RepID=A0A371CXZ3_9APHY|nr:hypothetical protein OH76DRAFT_1015052 [Polyporus brumalis]